MSDVNVNDAILLSDAPSKRKSLNAVEKEEYIKRHQHIFSFGLVMSDISKIETEQCFLEGQRKCLEKEPKLQCSIPYLLSQLEKMCPFVNNL